MTGMRGSSGALGSWAPISEARIKKYHVYKGVGVYFIAQIVLLCLPAKTARMLTTENVSSAQSAAI